MDISDKDAALALVDKGPYDGVINLPPAPVYGNPLRTRGCM
jgi:hypothetical protein